jgi:hypothetical protein
VTRTRLVWVAASLALAVLGASSTAAAQGLGGSRGGGNRQQPKAQQPRAPTPEEEEEVHNAYVRASEPEIAPPSSPLSVSPEISERIGSDYAAGPPSPEGPLRRSIEFPFYVERRGDYRLRLALIPPLLIEQTRGLRDPSQDRYGVPRATDTEGLYGMVYYQRTSPKLDMHVVFPGFWHVHERDEHGAPTNDVVVAGPLVHREAPFENDNWLAPLVFEGARKDGGYIHMPLLLTTSHWGEKGAFTLVGPYFRERTGSDVDLGVAPFFFHGDNGSIDGNRRVYTLIPPLLTYHSVHELDSSTFTLIGPVISKSDTKRDVFDVAPLYFHIRGKPETGGVVEEHTTLLPFFHYGRGPDQSLLILPGYYRRVTKNADTLLSIFGYSHAETHNGATSLTAAGPIVPVYWTYRDTELGVHAFALAPFFYNSSSPAGHDWLTPLVGHFETYAQTRTTWVFPTLTLNTNTHGWENDLHPLVYVGRNGDASHTVVAPFFWDFASPEGRTSIGFPFYWRFAEGRDQSVLQVAANSVYIQKRVVGGNDWQFHFAPLFSYGEDPRGYFWNVLFGLAGYSHHGTETQTRVFWIPFDGTSAPLSQTARGY